MGWLIALGVIVLLAVIPLGISARYDADGARAKLILGPVWLQIYPGKQKTGKEKQPKKKKAKQKTENQSQQEAKQEQGGSLMDFMPILELILELLVEFRRKLRVERLELKLTLAGDDPGDLAINYGRAWAALGNLEPQLERFFIIRKKDLQVQCDFEAENTSVMARADLTITLGRLLRLVLCYGFRGLREYLKIMKSRKGGAIQ